MVIAKAALVLAMAPAWQSPLGKAAKTRLRFQALLQLPDDLLSHFPFKKSTGVVVHFQS